MMFKGCSSQLSMNQEQVRRRALNNYSTVMRKNYRLMLAELDLSSQMQKSCY